MKKKRMNILIVIVLSAMFCCSIHAAEPRVIVYSMPGCGPCKALKKYLDEKKVPYKEYDITKDRSAKEEMGKKSRQGGVPVLDLNGNIMVGFGPEQKKKIARLLDKQLLDKTPTPSETPTPSVVSREGYLYVYVEVEPHGASVRIANLKEIFTFAEKNVVDANAVDILKKLSEAYMARIIYETSFTDQFQKKVGEMFAGDEMKKREAIRTAKTIASNNYFHSLSAFQDVCVRDLRAENEARQALKLEIARKTGEGKEMSGKYVDKVWACIAKNLRTGYTLQPTYGKLNPKQDAITIKVVRALNEMAGISEKTDADEVREPNNLVTNSPVVKESKGGR